MLHEFALGLELLPTDVALPGLRPVLHELVVACVRLLVVEELRQLLVAAVTHLADSQMPAQCSAPPSSFRLLRIVSSYVQLSPTLQTYGLTSLCIAR